MMLSSQSLWPRSSSCRVSFMMPPVARRLLCRRRTAWPDQHRPGRRCARSERLEAPALLLPLLCCSPAGSRSEQAQILTWHQPILCLVMRKQSNEGRSAPEFYARRKYYCADEAAVGATLPSRPCALFGPCGLAPPLPRTNRPGPVERRVATWIVRPRRGTARVTGGGGPPLMHHVGRERPLQPLAQAAIAGRPYADSNREAGSLQSG